MKDCCGPQKIYVHLNQNFIEKNKLTVICGLPCCEAFIRAHKLLTKSEMSFDSACWNLNDNLKTEVEREYKFHSCPMIFLEGKFIGGYHELKSKLSQVEKYNAGLNMDTVKEKTKEVANTAMEKGKVAKDKIVEKGGQMKDKTNEWTKKGSEKAKNSKENIAEKAKNSKENIAEKAGEMKDKGVQGAKDMQK